MEVSLKKFLLSFISLFFVSPIFALMPFFTGFAGFLTNIGNDFNSEENKIFDPEVTAEAYFSGQLDFNGNFLLRGEFFIEANDLVDQNFFEEPASENAFFRIEEISATYRFNSANSSHYLSAFLGNFEPIGSDVFLQRQFGIKAIGSFFTESWHGLSGASVYPFYGAGLSYVLNPSFPWALGFFFYVNTETQDEITTNIINSDIRFASVLSWLTADISTGLSFPLETSDDAGTEVILIVRKVQLHAGFDLLFGNKNTFSFFLQGGFNKFTLNPSKTNSSDNKLSFSDLYFIVEPRFALRQCNIDLSLFNIPSESADDMLYLKHIVSGNSSITNLLGANLCVVTDNLYLGNINFTFGIHTTFCFTDSVLADAISSPANILSWTKKLYVTPFTSVPVFGGQVKAEISASVFDLMSWENIKNAFRASVGFRSQF